MKILVTFLLVLGCLPVWAEKANFEKDFRFEVKSFVESLDEEQRGSCVLELKDKKRWKMQYTGGVRAGLEIGKLNEGQRSKLEKVMKMVLSDYGWKMANDVALQDGEVGLGKYYVACFGDVAGDFAFRVAEHHLTLVHLEVLDGKAEEFGPILLGANPPVLWEAEEKSLMKVWDKVKGVDGILEKGNGIASKEMTAEDGVLFSTLDGASQAAVKEAWVGRLSIFKKPMQDKIERLFTVRGGWSKARVAFYKGAAVKRCKDGGKWDFKCGVPGFVWDFEGSRGHIHMSFVAKPQK